MSSISKHAQHERAMKFWSVNMMKRIAIVLTRLLQIAKSWLLIILVRWLKSKILDFVCDILQIYYYMKIKVGSEMLKSSINLHYSYIALYVLCASQINFAPFNLISNNIMNNNLTLYSLNSFFRRFFRT